MNVLAVWENRTVFTEEYVKGLRGVLFAEQRRQLENCIEVIFGGFVGLPGEMGILGAKRKTADRRCKHTRRELQCERGNERNCEEVVGIAGRSIQHRESKQTSRSEEEAKEGREEGEEIEEEEAKD